MKKLVLPVTGFGMSLLIVGLIIATVFECTGRDLAAAYSGSFGKMPPAYVVANIFWTLGAIILIFPPAVAGFELLVVLEIFLTISGLMAFWQPESIFLKILSRISMSLLAVGYLKKRGLLPNFSFPWSLLSPRFYYESWTSGDNRALAVGLEMLGIGYALSSMFMLTLGSAYLVRSAWATWKKSHEPIFAAWTALNFAYTFSGIVILLARVAK
jgi:hypothetical protein